MTNNTPLLIENPYFEILREYARRTTHIFLSPVFANISLTAKYTKSIPPFYNAVVSENIGTTPMPLSTLMFNIRNRALMEQGIPTIIWKRPQTLDGTTNILPLPSPITVALNHKNLKFLSSQNISDIVECAITSRNREEFEKNMDSKFGAVSSIMQSVFRALLEQTRMFNTPGYIVEDPQLIFCGVPQTRALVAIQYDVDSYSLSEIEKILGITNELKARLRQELYDSMRGIDEVERIRAVDEEFTNYLRKYIYEKIFPTIPKFPKFFYIDTVSWRYIAVDTDMILNSIAIAEVLYNRPAQVLRSIIQMIYKSVGREFFSEYERKLLELASEQLVIPENMRTSPELRAFAEKMRYHIAFIMDSKLQEFAINNLHLIARLNIRELLPRFTDIRFSFFERSFMCEIMADIPLLYNAERAKVEQRLSRANRELNETKKKLQELGIREMAEEDIMNLPKEVWEPLQKAVRLSKEVDFLRMRLEELNKRTPYAYHISSDFSRSERLIVGLEVPPFFFMTLHSVSKHTKRVLSHLYTLPHILLSLNYIAYFLIRLVDEDVFSNVYDVGARTLRSFNLADWLYIMTLTETLEDRFIAHIFYNILHLDTKIYERLRAQNRTDNYKEEVNNKWQMFKNMIRSIAYRLLATREEIMNPFFTTIRIYDDLEITLNDYIIRLYDLAKVINLAPDRFERAKITAYVMRWIAYIVKYMSSQREMLTTIGISENDLQYIDEILSSMVVVSKKEKERTEETRETEETEETEETY